MYPTCSKICCIIFIYGDDDEIEKRMCKMRVQANVLGLRFAKASFKVKKKLFSTFFSTIYCIGLWVPSKRIIRRVKVAHNNCFRAVFKKMDSIVCRQKWSPQMLKLLVL